MIVPPSFKFLLMLQRSPRSTPIVSFCSLKISLPNTCTVLIFFIAGLLLCLEHVFHWERIASRWRPAFSSHLIKVTVQVPISESTSLVIRLTWQVDRDRPTQMYA